MNAMLRVALRKFRGLLHQLEVNILGDKGDVWEKELKKFLRQEPCWVKEAKVGATKVANKLLEYITSVQVPAVERLAAADHFKVGQTVDGVKYYSSFGSNFVTSFLPKVESNVSAMDLRVHKLLRNSKDLGIRAEIGEDREETHLANIHELLKLQGEGQKGVLLTNGRANIFYVRDIHGILWAVNVGWYDGGWCLDAYSVGYPRGWFAGFQVFSR